MNRAFVRHGLARIRAGRAQPGILALFSAAGRDPRRATRYDLGFVAGPRLNAAGRLSDMAIGIRCLLADTAATALPLAQELDRLNRERRDVEATMQDERARRARRAQDRRNRWRRLHAVPLRRGMASGRGRHRRGAAQGPVPSPGDRLCARRDRRPQGFGPLHRRLPFARRAGSRFQACARGDREIRRPRVRRGSDACRRRPAAVCRGVRDCGTRAALGRPARAEPRIGRLARAGRARFRARCRDIPRGLGPGLSRRRSSTTYSRSSTSGSSAERIRS